MGKKRGCQCQQRECKDLTSAMNNRINRGINGSKRRSQQYLLQRITLNLKDVIRINKLSRRYFEITTLIHKVKELKCQFRMDRCNRVHAASNSQDPTCIQVINIEEEGRKKASSVIEIIDVEAEWRKEASSGIEIIDVEAEWKKKASSGIEIIDIEAESSARAPAEREINPPNAVANDEADSSEDTVTDEEEEAVDLALVALLERCMRPLNRNHIDFSDIIHDLKEEIRLKFEVALENVKKDTDSSHVDEMARLLQLYPLELIPEPVKEYYLGGF